MPKDLTAEFAREAGERQYYRALPVSLLRAREASVTPFRVELDRIGLTLQQWRVIRSLAERGAMTAGELAENCVLLPPSLSRILKTLTERGILERIEDGDARRRRVKLTDDGFATYDRMARRSVEIYARLEAAFGADKLDLLIDLLVDLQVTADRLNDKYVVR